VQVDKIISVLKEFSLEELNGEWHVTLLVNKKMILIEQLLRSFDDS